MSYRIYDESALDRAPGKFELSLTLPSSTVDGFRNPDGSNPVATLAVKADTARSALYLLFSIRSNLESLTEELIEQILTDAVNEGTVGESVYEDTDKDAPNEEQTKFMNLLAFKNFEKFPSLNFSLALTLENGKKIEGDFVITAPSPAIMFEVLHSLTGSKRLNSLMASFMPLDHEMEGMDDDYYDD